MSVQTAARTARTRLRRIFPVPADHSTRSVRLPLQMELFLIAHDDDTGRPHLDQRQLEKGLAAAILLELWLTERISVGWRFDARTGCWQLDRGRISVLNPNPIGDPLTDAALTQIWRAGTLRVKEFVRRFASHELYERIRGDMIATGVIKRATRRRFLFFRRETHVPVHDKLSVRARTKVRDLVDQADQQPDTPDDQADGYKHSIALACLVTALGLTRNLYPSQMSAVDLHRKLADLLDSHRDNALREVTVALDPHRKSRSAAPTG